MTVKTELLKEAFGVFSQENTFNPGDIVVQKRGMALRKQPTQENPGIVVEVLSEPVISCRDESSGSPLYYEPLDIKVARIDDDGDFLIFHHDSRRLEHYSEQ